MDDITAKVGSKGQVTIPKKIRDALGIDGGDEIVFRLDGGRAVLAGDEQQLDPPADAKPQQPSTGPAAPWDTTRRTLLNSRGKPPRSGEPASLSPETEIIVDLRAGVEAEVDETQT